MQVDIHVYVHYVCVYVYMYILYVLFRFTYLSHYSTDLNSSVVQPLIEMNRPAIDSLLNGILTINDSKTPDNFTHTFKHV